MKAAPIGGLSLLAVALTAICFPLVRILDGWGSPISAVLVVTCGFVFTPALTCAVYSILFEKSKLWGWLTLLIGGLTIVIQRETLYFVEMGIGLVPATLLAMLIVAKRRNRNRRPDAGRE